MTWRNFRRTLFNEETGRTRIQVISDEQIPTDLAAYEVREGWRVLSIEELDELPREVYERGIQGFLRELRRQHPGVTFIVRDPSD
jgi:hypothetical protein